MYTWHVSGFVLRRFNSTHNRTRLTLFYGNCESCRKFGNYRKKIGIWFRQQSIQIAYACTRQFEFIAAQRIRRSLQIFHLYTRIWEEVALKEFIRSWRSRVARNTRHFLLSAIGVTMYDWERNKISDEEINSYTREIERIYKLRDNTVVCTTCHKRIIIDTAQPNIDYCKCDQVKTSAAMTQDPEGWQPFIERKDMLVWRRQEPEKGGLYAYKVYGSFPEVTAEDFLQVQIDVDYRKEWDPTARELHIVESDPSSMRAANHSTDIVYWEMIWPRLFSNRDYVYQRRWIVDREKRIIVIVSKVTDHPKVPVKPGTYRVSTYWSYMVIRPYKDFHEPGIEFGLTYFDDPGVNVPTAVTAWVAMTGLPDFLIRMRQASKDYEEYKAQKESKAVLDDNVFSQTDDNSESRIEETFEDLIEEKLSLPENKTIEEHGISNDVTILIQAVEEDDESEDEEALGESKKQQGPLYHFLFSKLFT